jgi:hypothetical protein
MVELTAPPRDPVLAGCVGEPQQKIAIACERCAEAEEVVPAQFVKRSRSQPSYFAMTLARSPSGPILNGVPRLLRRPM